MTRFPHTFLFALLLASNLPTHAAGLPDTGQDTCYNDTVADGVSASNPASIARDAGTHPRQNCRYGRDAAAAVGLQTKTGAGAKGFDYTKIANNGSTLASGAALGTAATDWACTKDNVTGLTWEVKVNDAAHLRHQTHTYTWYNSDGATNSGIAGNTGANTCNTTLPSSLCNTEAFVTAVNAAALCTYTDWRMPTLRELFTLFNADGSSPSIDSSYFPNTSVSYYWSGSSSTIGLTDAWNVDFWDGYRYALPKTSNFNVRLVRGGQF